MIPTSVILHLRALLLLIIVIDTGKSGNETGKYERITHGSYFTVAYEEGHMTNRSVHGGIRQKMRVCSRLISP